VPAAR
jgi:hypothetical protein